MFMNDLNFYGNGGKRLSDILRKIQINPDTYLLIIILMDKDDDASDNLFNKMRTKHGITNNDINFDHKIYTKDTKKILIDLIRQINSNEELERLKNVLEIVLQKNLIDNQTRITILLMMIIDENICNEMIANFNNNINVPDICSAIK